MSIFFRFSDAQLLGYDAFWDAVRVENTIISDALKKGLAEGREKGLAEGMAKGMAEEKLATAKRLLDMGLDVQQTAKGTGLSIEEVEKLLHS